MAPSTRHKVSWEAWNKRIEAADDAGTAGASQKLGDTIDSSSQAFRTCDPADLAKITADGHRAHRGSAHPE